MSARLEQRWPAWQRSLASDSLADFMTSHSHNGQWMPERPEATILGGSPPPRRRRGNGRRSPLAPNVIMDGVQTAGAAPMSISDSASDLPSVRPPENPVITLTDAQLRSAFGPSPIFGCYDTARPPAPFSDCSIHPPSPRRENSDDVDEELESLKHLSMNELLHVFRGTPIPESPLSSSC